MGGAQVEGREVRRAGLRASAVVVAALLTAAACTTFGTDGDTPRDGGPDERSDEGGSQPDGMSVTDASVDADGVVEIAKGFGRLAGIVADEQTVYFSDQGSGEVRSVSIDGQSSEKVVSANQVPRSIALTGPSLFWCDRQSVRSGTTHPLQLKTVADLANEVTVALAVSAGTVSVASVGEGGVGTITYLGLDLGTSVTTVAKIGNPFDIVASGTDVYWTESSNGTIGHGTPGSTVGTPFATSEQDCQSLAIDKSALYWTRPMLGLVRAKPFGGGATDLAIGENQPRSILASDGFVYWVAGGTDLRRIPSAGGPGAKAETIATGLQAVDDGYAHTLAANGTYLFWVTSTGSVFRMPKRK